MKFLLTDFNCESQRLLLLIVRIFYLLLRITYARTAYILLFRYLFVWSQFKVGFGVQVVASVSLRFLHLNRRIRQPTSLPLSATTTTSLFFALTVIAKFRR